MSTDQRILVTSALPYANGPIHLGHLAGAYLPADIYVRYQRMRQREVLFVCGTDEHGVAITIAAEKQGKQPKEFTDYYYNLIDETFKRTGISFDIFSRTTEPNHYPLAQSFFTKMLDKGLLVEKKIKQLYDPKDQRFLADRYVEGTCPHCHSSGARGDQCEACGKWIDPLELIDPVSVVSGARPEVRETRHFFIPLGKFQDQIREWLDTKKHWRDNVRNFCYGWIKEGLGDRAITRDLKWGVPVPHPGYENKVLYVWFDAPIGYISATKIWAEKAGKPEAWEEYWKNPETKLVHFIGKDNIVFHAIVWPAMLMAQGDYILPSDIPANEFLNLQGLKLSTSRGYAVWLHEYLDRFPVDPLRYTLAINLPETKDADFSWKELQMRNNSELADVLGNFINRTLTFIKVNFENKVPAAAELNDADRRMLDAIYGWPEKIAESYEKYELKRATKEFMTLAREANRYFNDEEPWNTLKSDRARCATTLHISLQVCKALAVLMYPTMPFAAEKLWKMLNLPGEVETQDWLTAPKEPFGQHHVLGKPKILFKKIEDEAIAPEIERLEEIKEKMMKTQTNASGESAGDEQPAGRSDKSEIKIDDFMKVDLRVAEVASAEKVEKADRLLRLKVRVAGEERQLVAGIAKQYDPSELVGKKVVIVANLQPAKIRGIESQGMLLAASSEDGKLSLLTPDDDIESGAKIK